MVYALLTDGREDRIVTSQDDPMTRIDKRFSALSDRMQHLSAPSRPVASSQSVASLLDKVNAAKRRYQPGAR